MSSSSSSSSEPAPRRGEKRQNSATQCAMCARSLDDADYDEDEKVYHDPIVILHGDDRAEDAHYVHASDLSPLFGSDAGASDYEHDNLNGFLYRPLLDSELKFIEESVDENGMVPCPVVLSLGEADESGRYPNARHCGRLVPAEKIAANVAAFERRFRCSCGEIMKRGEPKLFAQCGHRFHGDCIVRHITSNPDGGCLMCRAPRADRRAERIDITRLTDDRIAGRGLLRLVVTETFACEVFLLGGREPVPGMVGFLNSNSYWSNSYNANQLFNGLQRREVVYENPSAELLLACLRRVIQRRPQEREREPLFFSDSGVLYCDVLLRGDFGYITENGQRAELFERAVWRFDDATIELKNMEFMRDSTPAIRNYINVKSVSVRIGVYATDLTALRIAQSIMAVAVRFLPDDPVFAGGDERLSSGYMGGAVQRRTLSPRDLPGFRPTAGVRSGTDPAGVLCFLRDSLLTRYSRTAVFGVEVGCESRDAMIALSNVSDSDIIDMSNNKLPVFAEIAGVSDAEFAAMCIDTSSKINGFNPNFYMRTHFKRPFSAAIGKNEPLTRCLIDPTAAATGYPKIFIEKQAYLWRGRSSARLLRSVIEVDEDGRRATKLSLRGKELHPILRDTFVGGEKLSHVELMFAASASIVDRFDLADEEIRATVSERYVELGAVFDSSSRPSTDDWVRTYRVGTYRELMELLTTVFMPQYVHPLETKGAFEISHAFTVSGLEVCVRCPARGPASLFSHTRLGGERAPAPGRAARVAEARVSLFFDGAWRAYAMALRLVELEARFAGDRPSWPVRALALPMTPEQCRPLPISPEQLGKRATRFNALVGRTHPFEFLYGGGAYSGLVCFRIDTFPSYDPMAWVNAEGPFVEAVRSKAVKGAEFAVLSTLDYSQIEVIVYYKADGIVFNLHALPSPGLLDGALRATAADLATALLDAVATPEPGAAPDKPIAWVACSPEALNLSSRRDHCVLARNWVYAGGASAPMAPLRTEIRVLRNPGFGFKSRTIDESFRHAVSFVYAASPANQVEKARDNGGMDRTEWFPAPMESLADLVAFADHFKPVTVSDVTASWVTTKALVRQNGNEVGMVMRRRLSNRGTLSREATSTASSSSSDIGDEWVPTRAIGAIVSAEGLASARSAWAACSRPRTRLRARPAVVQRSVTSDTLYTEIVCVSYGSVANEVGTALSGGNPAAMSGSLSQEAETTQLVLKTHARWSTVRALERMVVCTYEDWRREEQSHDLNVASLLEEIGGRAHEVREAPEWVLRTSFRGVNLGADDPDSNQDRSFFREFRAYEFVLPCGVLVKVDGLPGRVSWVLLEWREELLKMPTMDTVRSEFPAYDYYSNVIVRGFSSPFAESTPPFDVLPRRAIGGCRSVTLHSPLTGLWRDTHAPLPRALPVSLEELVIGDGFIYEFKARDVLRGELPVGITHLDLGCLVSVDARDDWTWDWASASGAEARLRHLSISGMDLKFSDLNHRLPHSLNVLKLEGLFSNRGLAVTEENSPLDALTMHSRIHDSREPSISNLNLTLGYRFTNAGEILDAWGVFPKSVSHLILDGVTGAVRLPLRNKKASVKFPIGFRNGGRRVKVEEGVSIKGSLGPGRCGLCLGETNSPEAPESVHTPMDMLCDGCGLIFHADCLLEDADDNGRALGASSVYIETDPLKRVFSASCPYCGRHALPASRLAFTSGLHVPADHQSNYGHVLHVRDSLAEGGSFLNLTMSDAEIVSRSDALRKANEHPTRGRANLTPLFAALYNRSAVAVTVHSQHKSLSDEAEAIRVAGALLASSRLPMPHAPFVIAAALFSPMFMRGPLHPKDLRTLNVRETRPGHLLPLCLSGGISFTKTLGAFFGSLLALSEPIQVGGDGVTPDTEVREADPPLWRAREMALADTNETDTWDFIFTEVMRRWRLETLKVSRHLEGEPRGAVKLTPFVLSRIPRWLVTLEIDDPDSVLVAPINESFLPSSLRRLVLRVGGILWTSDRTQKLLVKAERDPYDRFRSTIDVKSVRTANIIHPRFFPGGLEELELTQLNRPHNDLPLIGLDGNSLPRGLRELTLGGEGTARWGATWDTPYRDWLDAIEIIMVSAISGESSLERLSVDGADARGLASVATLSKAILQKQRPGDYQFALLSTRAQFRSFLANITSNLQNITHRLARRDTRNLTHNVGLRVPRWRAGEAERALGATAEALAGRFYSARHRNVQDAFGYRSDEENRNPDPNGASGEDEEDSDPAESEEDEEEEEEESVADPRNPNYEPRGDDSDEEESVMEIENRSPRNAALSEDGIDDDSVVEIDPPQARRAAAVLAPAEMDPGFAADAPADMPSQSSLMSISVTDGVNKWFVAPNKESIGLRAVVVTLTETFTHDLPRGTDPASVALWTEALGPPRSSADGTLRFRKEFSSILRSPTIDVCVALVDSVSRAVAPRAVYVDFDYSEDRGRQAVARIDSAGTGAASSVFTYARASDDESVSEALRQVQWATPQRSAALGRSVAAAVKFAVPRDEAARSAFRAIVDAATGRARSPGDMRELVAVTRLSLERLAAALPWPVLSDGRPVEIRATVYERRVHRVSSNSQQARELVASGWTYAGEGSSGSGIFEMRSKGEIVMVEPAELVKLVASLYKSTSGLYYGLSDLVDAKIAPYEARGQFLYFFLACVFRPAPVAQAHLDSVFASNEPGEVAKIALVFPMTDSESVRRLGRCVEIIRNAVNLGDLDAEWQSAGPGAFMHAFDPAELSARTGPPPHWTIVGPEDNRAGALSYESVMSMLWQ
jgi:hypothetical protein